MRLRNLATMARGNWNNPSHFRLLMHKVHSMLNLVVRYTTVCMWFDIAHELSPAPTLQVSMSFFARIWGFALSTGSPLVRRWNLCEFSFHTTDGWSVRSRLQLMLETSTVRKTDVEKKCVYTPAAKIFPSYFQLGVTDPESFRVELIHVWCHCVTGFRFPCLGLNWREGSHFDLLAGDSNTSSTTSHTSTQVIRPCFRFCAAVWHCRLFFACPWTWHQRATTTFTDVVKFDSVKSTASSFLGRFRLSLLANGSQIFCRYFHVQRRWDDKAMFLAHTSKCLTLLETDSPKKSCLCPSTDRLFVLLCCLMCPLENCSEDTLSSHGTFACVRLALLIHVVRIQKTLDWLLAKKLVWVPAVSFRRCDVRGKFGEQAIDLWDPRPLLNQAYFGWHPEVPEVDHRAVQGQADLFRRITTTEMTTEKRNQRTNSSHILSCWKVLTTSKVSACIPRLMSIVRLDLRCCLHAF